MRCIAEQRYPWYAVPSVLNRERMDRAKHRVSLSVGDERRQLWSPAVEFLDDVGQGSLRVGEVDAVNPVLWLFQLHVRVQHVIGFTMREDAFSRSHRKTARHHQPLPRSLYDGCHCQTGTTAWSQLDPQKYPFTRSVAGLVRAHDDRMDFLAGIDLILRGIDSPRRR
jgi:hypothetical protein